MSKREDYLLQVPHHIRCVLTERTIEVTDEETIIQFWSMTLGSGLKNQEYFYERTHLSTIKPQGRNHDSDVPN